MIEIMKYVPHMLLKDKEIGQMDMDEFMTYLAYARYVEEMEKENIMRAISEVFNDE